VADPTAPVRASISSTAQVPLTVVLGEQREALDRVHDMGDNIQERNGSMYEKRFFHTLCLDAVDSPSCEEQTHCFNMSRSGDPALDESRSLIVAIRIYRHQKSCPYYNRLVRLKKEAGQDHGIHGVYEGDDLSQNRQDCTCGIADKTQNVDL